MVLSSNEYLSVSFGKLNCVAHQIYDNLFQATLIPYESRHELFIPRSSKQFNIGIAYLDLQVDLPGSGLRSEDLINVLHECDRTENRILKLNATKFNLLQV